MLAEPIIDVRRVKIECPACGKEQFVKLKVENLVARNGVVSLVIRAACDHEFNLYLDKQFQVRGYERIDAVVSAEMMQVDQEISDFMKDEGIKASVSGKFIGRLRNDLERERNLETVIRYFRGADGADSYWIPAIGGKRPDLPKLEAIDPAKAFPLPPAPATLPAPAGLPAAPPRSAPPGGFPPAPSSPALPKLDPVKAFPLPPVQSMNPPAKTGPASTSAHGSLPKLPAIPAAPPSPKAELVMEAEIIPTVALAATEHEIAVKAEVEAEAEVEVEAVPTPEPAETTVPEISIEELKCQYETRVKKISELMIKLELENLNESVTDVELVKKKAKLIKIKEDLEIQFNKILQERGLMNINDVKCAATSA